MVLGLGGLEKQKHVALVAAIALGFDKTFVTCGSEISKAFRAHSTAFSFQRCFAQGFHLRFVDFERKMQRHYRRFSPSCELS